ncbi:MAG TPA: hypothetical protein VJV78_43705 [Polyangiales bacterium]|nr:hypothetical protein [Polyangiales bacterium]
MNTKRQWIGLALIVALSGHSLIGCGDDGNESPSEEDGGTSGKGGKGGGGGKGGKGGGGGKGGTGGKSGSGGKAGSDDDAGVAGSSGKGGTGGKGGSGGSSSGGDCKGDKGCYSCEPKNYEQYLNACTDAVCNAYDNSKLKKLENGKVPPIP